jgi:heteromeric Ino2p/Ino4p transcription factor
MSSPNKTTSEKPRLTEQEKKNNHIASEQKRRQAIRDGFDRLASIVPGMEGQGRSEAVVLGATIKYMRAQISERKRLLDIARERGIDTSGWELPEGLGEKGNSSSGSSS